jgi:hypothetical protein
MDDGSAPVSLGDRLDLVALVGSAAVVVVLVSNLALALTANLGEGAAPSPVRQRIAAAARPADLTLALVVLVSACALAIRRWLNGDHPTPSDALGRLVVGAAAAVTALALVGMFAESLWWQEGALWGARAAVVGQHLATAALAALATMLALPGGRFPTHPRG